MQLAVASVAGSAVSTLNQYTADDTTDIENQRGGDDKDNNNGNDNKDDSDDDTEKGCLGRTVMKYGIQVLSLVSVGTALASMILTVAHLVDISSICTALLSPWVFYQKMRLQRTGGMRGQYNMLRQKVNRLAAENGKLKSSIDDLEQQNQALKHVEVELQQYADQAGADVNRLRYIVKENGQIQAQIKSILNNGVVQQIIAAMVNTDTDNDYVLNKREVRMLEYRLKNIPGIIFHHDRFQAFLASDDGELTLADVTRLARNLQDLNIPASHRIFEYDIKQLSKPSSNSVIN